MSTEEVIKLAREEQLALENANLKIEVAKRELQFRMIERDNLAQSIAHDHQLQDGNFQVNVEEGVIRRRNGSAQSKLTQQPRPAEPEGSA